MTRSRLSPILPALLVAAAGSTAAAQCGTFTLTPSTGAAIVPGTTDTGNHGDDVTTGITLPFSFSFLGGAYTAANVSSNGNLQFTTNSGSYTNDCIPSPTVTGPTIFPHWDDLRTDGTGNGVFTSVTGSAPNRVFNIEWRSVYYGNTSQSANFEVRLYEGAGRFDLVYGAVAQAGSSATVGVQGAAGANPTQFECNTGGITAGLQLSFVPNTGSNILCGNGSANPATAYNCSASTTLLTVTPIPGTNPPSTGLAVTANLADLGGNPSQAFYDDGTHGDATSGDGVFSFRLPTASMTPGGKAASFTMTDAQGRSGAGTITFNVTPCPTRGPDVFVGGLTDVANYGALNGITAYAVGTDACNAGDLPVSWYNGTPRHPLIGGNMFRYKQVNGAYRFEQIGQSWLKYAFSSTNSNSCGTCQQPPDGGQQLGVACSDAYGSGLNGSQGGLGPRSTCNATTGVFPASHAPGDTTTVIGNRLQVMTADVNPSGNANARYFVDAHYVTADDAQYSDGAHPASNGLNNVSYQEITGVYSTATPPAAPTLTGGIHRMSPAIQAWKDIDASVSIANADYLDMSFGAVPAGITARFIVAGKATDLGNGQWHYEYAVYNVNADRAGGSFSIPVPAGANITNTGFHGVFAHSGEPYPNTATNPDNWSGVVSNGAVTWRVPETFTGNGDNGNAIRWGTMYNFRFDSSIPPVSGAATLGLWKPGTPASITATGLPVPRACHGQCVADFDDGSGTGMPDGGVTIDDLLYYLGLYNQGAICADIDNGTGSGVPDQGVTIDDLLYYLGLYNQGC